LFVLFPTNVQTEYFLQYLRDVLLHYSDSWEARFKENKKRRLKEERAKAAESQKNGAKAKRAKLDLIK